MRIRIVQSGGFAGLRRERVVETTALPAPERDALERLVHASGFFARAAVGAGKASGEAGAHRDARQVDLEIDDGAGRSHALRLSDAATDPALQDLVDRAWAAGEPAAG